MARALRLSFEGAFYHITTRGMRKENIFYSDKDKLIFIDKINETFYKYSFICYAYHLVDNHYHLFIKFSSGQKICKWDKKEQDYFKDGRRSWGNVEKKSKCQML